MANNQFSIKWLFLSIILFSLQTKAQDCGCTVTDVLQNKVQPCTRTIGLVDTVYSTAQLRVSIVKANATGGNRTILIADGTYRIASAEWYPYITASNIIIRSLSGDRDKVFFLGQGMKSAAPKVEIGIFAVGDSITIADITIGEVGNHAIAATGEHLLVHNVRIIDTYEQMIKGTSANDGADNAIVQCSLFEYTAKEGPQYYIGGLDIHDGDFWRVNDNVFQYIISPSQQTAEHAIHFWNNSSHNIVERNFIRYCDRGIGFGLGTSSNEGGVIKNNLFYHDGRGSFDDVGIGLESSPSTKVLNNTIFIDYPNAIEYRFGSTKNVTITNNLSNKIIKKRDGASASLAANVIDGKLSWFKDLINGDINYQMPISQVLDKGLDLSPEVQLDFYGNPRPAGKGFDIGASEHPQGLNVNDIGRVTDLQLYVNAHEVRIDVNQAIKHSIEKIQIRNVHGQLVRELRFDPNLPMRFYLPEGIYYFQAISPIFVFPPHAAVVGPHR